MPSASSPPVLVEKSWQTLGSVLVAATAEPRLITVRCAPAMARDLSFARAVVPQERVLCDLRLLTGDSAAALSFCGVSACSAGVLVEAFPLAAGDALFIASTFPGTHVAWATW